MSISFLRMQWRSSTWVVSVFRCLVSLVCQCRAICCRLRPLESTTRLSKSHLSGLVPGKKLESELHAIRLFPFSCRFFLIFFFFFFIYLDNDEQCEWWRWRWWWRWWFSFFLGRRVKNKMHEQSKRDQWADDRWTMDPWCLAMFLSVVWSLTIVAISIRRHLQYWRQRTTMCDTSIDV